MFPKACKDLARLAQRGDILRSLRGLGSRCFTTPTGQQLLRSSSFGYPGEMSRVGDETSMRILVTGAAGQIGQELVPALRERYGNANVVATDIRSPGAAHAQAERPFCYCDVMQKDTLIRLVLEHNINCIVHNASILSAIGERNPQLALKINTEGAQNVLEVAVQNGIRVFAPSTIAVFGPSTPRVNTPDHTIMRPTTIYGITKIHLELLGMYYHDNYDLDFRSLRYPGVISSKTLPGGGTTDYAVEIYYDALKKGHYTSFLKDDTAMPMMYMEDCLKATLMLLDAPNENLSERVYNVTAMSFTPRDLAESIQKIFPKFTIDYAPDFRQKIADTWPTSIDDNLARRDWNWEPDYDIDMMTKEMLTRLSAKLNIPMGPSSNSSSNSN